MALSVPGDVSPFRRSSWWRAAGAFACAAFSLTAFYLWSYRDCIPGFFHFDDYWVLAAAGRIHIGRARDLLQFFTSVHGFLLYRPVSTLVYFFLLHLCFGYDPIGYHATQIAFHIINALLVYAIADTLLFSRPLALATALVYATAPGHAIAACWMALFTMTGTAFFYFLGLWVWLRLDSRWRVPITFLLFIIALLASEHAVSFPLVLTLTAVLLPSRCEWRRLVREQVAFYVVGFCYVAAKLYYLRRLLPRDFPSPAAQAYVAAGYGVSLAPESALRHLGQYFGFSVDLAYRGLESDTAMLTIGVGIATLALVSTGLVLAGRWTARPLRVAVFGLDVFIVTLAPVLVLPGHLFSYYVGIAAMGIALALIGFARALPGMARAITPWAVAGVLLATHVLSTATLVRQSEEFHFFNGFSGTATRWLYTLSGVAQQASIKEVLVPENGLTRIVFDVGHAHELFLCAHYAVRTVARMDDIRPAPGQVIIREPWRLPRSLSGTWDWLPRACEHHQPPTQ